MVPFSDENRAISAMNAIPAFIEVMVTVFLIQNFAR
ncbi:hypothetical protein MMMDOFMJ_1347 [Methylobacterium gnaphalii]|nr:hypothetical protein MMMDOFMJ_1347 [Methylobacterium gnaphalii]